MTDPFNQLPTMPEFVRNLDAAAAHATDVLGCAVVLIAVQENGKMAVCVEGVEDGSTLDNALKAGGVPRLLQGLSIMCALMDAHGAAGVKS
jgi:hypothetical protein